MDDPVKKRVVRIATDLRLTPERDLNSEVLEERAARAAARWQLTPSQSRVLRHLATGASCKEIAAAIGCAEGTVELHVTQLLRKACVDSRARLIAAFWST